MPGVANLRFAGDVYIDKDDPKSIVSDVMDLTNAADIMIANLEVPMCDIGTPVERFKNFKEPLYRSSPKNLEALTAAGINSVSVANNHSLNYGWEGLGQMLGLMDDLGIVHAGGGANINEAHKPAISTVQGLKCALLSYTSIYTRGAFEASEDRGGLACVKVDTLYEVGPLHFEVPATPPTIRTVVSDADRARVQGDIERARREADIVMIGWHWGIGHSGLQVFPYQVELAHMAIDAGADIVVGHHPHRLQPMEFYKDKLICYSLGNFCFPTWKEHFRLGSMILEVAAGKGGSIESVRVHPTWLEPDGRPLPLRLDDARTKAILDQLSYNSNASFEPTTSEGCVEVFPSDSVR